MQALFLAHVAMYIDVNVLAYMQTYRSLEYYFVVKIIHVKKFL